MHAEEVTNLPEVLATKRQLFTDAVIATAPQESCLDACRFRFWIEIEFPQRKLGSGLLTDSPQLYGVPAKLKFAIVVCVLCPYHTKPVAQAIASIVERGNVLRVVGPDAKMFAKKLQFLSE